METSEVPDEDDVYFQGIPATDTAMLGVSDRIILIQQKGDSVNAVLLERPQLDSLFLVNPSDPHTSRKIFLWKV